MDKTLILIASLILSMPLSAQRFIPQIFSLAPTGSSPIALDASCTGNPSSSNPASCGSAMTVTTGDTITVEVYINGTSFDPGNIVCMDTSSITITGTGTDVIAYHCVGN